MTDIVERLRQMPSSLNDALRTMDEAADEIERLRREYKLIRDDWERLLAIGVRHEQPVQQGDRRADHVGADAP